MKVCGNFYGTSTLKKASRNSPVHYITTPVVLNNQTDESFRTTVRVSQGYLVSRVLFKLYLEDISRDVLDNTTVQQTCDL